MSFGQGYARSYDAFYQSKDYPSEARFVCNRLAAILGDRPLSILDIGCGTAMHDIELVKAGHRVIGADMSAGMLARAEERRRGLPAEWRDRLSFVQGDARSLQTGETYDAVISLFHVMSYMAEDGAFDEALHTARTHLSPGGAILFDFWHGPAVLADPPQRRQREVEADGRHILRITTPHWDKSRNTVRIDFDVTETDVMGATQNTHEEHLMRYFFEADLHKSLTKAGFEIVEIAEWLTGAAPHDKAFGVYAAAKAV